MDFRNIMRYFNKTKLIYAFLILIGIMTSFVAGFYVAQNIFVQTYEEIKAFNTFAQYETSRDIAKSLKFGNYKLAKCQADLEASSKFDYVKKCMEDKQCSISIANDVKERTPEVLANTPLSFDYLQRKGDIRHCD